MKLSVVQESRKGARPYNQDRVAYRRTEQALLMVLADGMGGYAGGELAAQSAVQSVQDDFAAQAKPRLSNPEVFLSQAMARAHDAIRRQARAAGLGDAPRTTLVACVVQSGLAYWSYVGDSRLYLIREGRIATRTKDHTTVQQLIDAGRMREEALPSYPGRNELLRCLGGPDAPQFERPVSATLAQGDIVLLCSDGLWGPLTPRLLVLTFIGKEPSRALGELFGLAESRAGDQGDNLSAVLMQWHEVTAAR